MNKIDRSIYFNHAMKSYKEGFGIISATSNYWLGLNNMYKLSNQEMLSARIELYNSEYDKYVIEYDM